MPVVPVQTKAISTDVPGPTTFRLPEAGGLGTAIQSAGAQVGGEAFDLIRQMKESEAVTAASSAHAQDQIDSQTAYNDFKSRSNDGNAYDESGKPVLSDDGTQMSLREQYRNWANDKFQSNQLSMPSALAQQKYQEAGRGYFTQQTLLMGHDQDVISTDSSKIADAKTLQSFSDNLTSTPDVNQAYQYSNTLSSSIMDKVGTGIYTASEGQQLILRANQQISESLLKGAHNQVLAGSRSGVSMHDRAAQVDQWRRVLNGDDGAGGGPDPLSAPRAQGGLPTISNMLNPDTKASLDRGLIELKKQATELDTSEFNRTFSDSLAALQSGNGNRVNPGAIVSKINQMVAAGKMKPEAAADSKAQLVAAGSLGQLNSPAFSLASSGDQQRMVDDQAKRIYATAQASGADKAAGSRVEMEFRKQSAQAIQNAQSEKQKDFPDYVQSVDPSLRSDVSQLDFTNPQSFQDKGPIVQSVLQKTQVYYNQSFSGQPQFARIVSKDQSTQLASALKNPMLNPEQTANAVNALKTSYGPAYPELITQMVKDGKLSESWNVAGFLSGPFATQDMVSAIKGHEADSKNFKSVADSRGVTESTFEKTLASKLSPWVTTMTNQNPGDPSTAQTTSALQSVVKTKAMQIYTADGGNTSPDEASAKAVHDILGQNASIEEASPGFFSRGRNYTYMVPNQTANMKLGDIEKAQVKQFVSANNTGEALKGMGVVGPPNASPTFLDDISKTGRFSLAQNYQGYNYFYVDPKSQREVPARVSDGKGGVKPLFIPISTMVQPTGMAPQARKTFSPTGGQ